MPRSETASLTASDAVLLVRDFVNTVEWQEDVDAWTTPRELERWFADRAGVTTGPQTDAELLLARRLREGLRNVLLRHAGHEPVRGAEADLDEVLAQVPLRLRVVADGQLLLAGGSAADPLAHVLAAVDASRAAGQWGRLKACARDSCRWAYWDASRNGSGRWCSMSWCGNTVKMRTRNGDPLRADELAPPLGEQRPARLIDVAARAGVSAKTVSNVVTGAAVVGPETRLRVEAALRELDYRPDLVARALRQGHGRRTSR